MFDTLLKCSKRVIFPVWGGEYIPGVWSKMRECASWSWLKKFIELGSMRRVVLDAETWAARKCLTLWPLFKWHYLLKGLHQVTIVLKLKNQNCSIGYVLFHDIFFDPFPYELHGKNRNMFLETIQWGKFYIAWQVKAVCYYTARSGC